MYLLAIKTQHSKLKLAQIGWLSFKQIDAMTQFLSLNPFTGYPFVREFDSRLFYSCLKHSSVNRQITLKTVFTFISHLDTISVPILIPSA